MQGEAVTLQEIFRFKEEGFDKNRKIIGQFQAMGMIPTFIEKFEQRGVKIPRNLFTSSGSNTPGASQPKKSGPTPVRSQRLAPRPTAPNLVKKKVSGEDQ